MAGKKPEILAPAGTYEAMEAAVKAGCDAVYAGGSLFSARAYAGNFDEASFLKAIDDCHFFGVRVYMTLNTLLKDSDMRAGDGLLRYVEPYYKAGLDAVLVQDMGVLKFLRDHFPDLPVHSSTQMSIASVYGARLAKELGFERIVPARELSLEEIRSIRENVEIEIETFVHGALCFSYSGKCLFSSIAGGRSGNRGRCAQPCRQCYELAGTRACILSLKDLCTLEHLPLLIDAGIDSFKIEGRMKNAFYVAASASAYRRARDLYLELKEKEEAESFETLSGAAKKEYLHLAQEMKENLSDIYNRGGFCSGYYFMEKGKEMSAWERPNHQGIFLGRIRSVKPPQIVLQLNRNLHKKDVLEIRLKKGEVIELTSAAEGKAGETVCLNAKNLKRIRPGMEVWRTRNEKLLSEIEETILKTEKAIPAVCRIRAHVGEPLKIRLETAGSALNPERHGTQKEDGTGQVPEYCSEVTGDLVEEAQRAPASETVLAEKIRKSRGSGVEITEVCCDLSPNAFIRMSAFNDLRRKAVSELKKAVLSPYRRT